MFLKFITFLRAMFKTTYSESEVFVIHNRKSLKLFHLLCTVHLHYENITLYTIWSTSSAEILYLKKIWSFGCVHCVSIFHDHTHTPGQRSKGKKFSLLNDKRYHIHHIKLHHHHRPGTVHYLSITISYQFAYLPIPACHQNAISRTTQTGDLPVELRVYVPQAGPVVEVPHLDGAIPGTSDESPLTGVKLHASDLHPNLFAVTCNSTVKVCVYTCSIVFYHTRLQRLFPKYYYN